MQFVPRNRLLPPRRRSIEALEAGEVAHLRQQVAVLAKQVPVESHLRRREARREEVPDCRGPVCVDREERGLEVAIRVLRDVVLQLAMFVPSFFTGQIIARLGAEKVCATGLALLGCAATAGLLGIGFGHFAVNLILLGLGWNFAFIGGTTLLTECYRPAEREKVQGLNDFAVFGTVAVASLTSGKLLDWFGWAAVNIAIFPMVAFAFALILWTMMKRLRTA